MRSKNKYDVYRWIEKVIDSCKTPRQFVSVNNLIENFLVLYNDFDLVAALRIRNNNAKFDQKYYEC